MDDKWIILRLATEWMAQMICAGRRKPQVLGAKNVHLGNAEHHFFVYRQPHLKIPSPAKGAFFNEIRKKKEIQKGKKSTSRQCALQFYSDSRIRHGGAIPRLVAVFATSNSHVRNLKSKYGDTGPPLWSRSRALDWEGLALLGGIKPKPLQLKNRLHNHSTTLQLPLLSLHT